MCREHCGEGRLKTGRSVVEAECLLHCNSPLCYACATDVNLVCGRLVVYLAQ